ncbi:MAG: YdcF family protein, partial [Alphaproteobacteria bacterium]|nr:YdcF family protein [Alphaproteobacteria bacterium]
MKKLAIITLSILVSIWIGGFLVFSQHINTYPKDYTTETEAIIVLTGGRNRIAEAVDLYNKGLAKKMFISGVN